MKISNSTRSVLLMSLFCLFLVAVRIFKTQQLVGLFLIWNLFLAWIPLFTILLTRRFYSRNQNKITLTFGIGAWLLFFPNAPYIITDLIHIEELPKNLMWFDSLGIFVCAMTGLLVGLYSLRITHGLLRQHFGSVSSWLIVGFFSIISGFGVYLGRYLRFNSWDLFTHPFRLIRIALAELKSPLCLQNTLIFGLTILLFYIAIGQKKMMNV
jgi:uncharacterized membrane protein